MEFESISEAPENATALLNRMSQGDGEAGKQLFHWLYQELRTMAHGQVDRDERQPTQQATAIVHEAYMRLFGSPKTPDWANRRQFFAAVAQIMRHIRIDDARKRKRLKRGGDRKIDSLDAVPGVFDHDPNEILAVHEVLEGLKEADGRKAELINLRFFAGLSEEETAEAMGLSRRTVQLEWRIARAWLYRALSKGDTGAPD